MKYFSACETALAGNFLWQIFSKISFFWKISLLVLAVFGLTSCSTSQTEAGKFLTYAQNIGLDMEQFKADYSSAVVIDRVDADYKESLRLNLPGTPSFFINGERIESPESYEAFKLLLQNAIQNAESGPVAAASDVDEIRQTDHVKGNSQAAVHLVEYSDFQCPACKAWAPVLSEAEKEFGDKVAFVYRHFPLDSHKNSKPAARAAEAAALQGKFWEMHDALFAGQDQWKDQQDPMRAL